MGVLDPIVDFFAELLGGIDAIFDAILNPTIDGVQAPEVLGGIIEEATPTDEIGAALVDTVEEFVLSDLQDAGELTPENVEAVTDATEGAAINVLAGLGLAGSAVEAASLGQIDQQQEYITQALAGLGVDDITGLEMEARIEEGVSPALEAKAAKEHRAQFVSLPDAVEYALRGKEDDDGYLREAGATNDVVDTIGSNEPVNSRNLLEEWGIRDDQLAILEEVSLEAMEFEELIETPAELGLVVPDDLLDEVLDLAGYPEDLKDFLRQVPDEIPRSNRAWEERTAAEALIAELDTLVRDGEISPGAARDLLPAEVELAADALEDRFSNLQTAPSGSPSGSDIEGSFASGYTDLSTFRSRLERLEYNTERYEGVLRKAVLDELDGDLQQAVGLGLLGEDAYSDYAEFAGLDDETVEQLLQGQGLDDVVKERLAAAAEPGSRSVGTIVGIGESRARALDGAGIETVADLAGADVETVAETSQVSPETAESFINQAQQRVT